MTCFTDQKLYLCCCAEPYLYGQKAVGSYTAEVKHRWLVTVSSVHFFVGHLPDISIQSTSHRGEEST